MDRHAQNSLNESIKDIFLGKDRSTKQVMPIEENLVVKMDTPDDITRALKNDLPNVRRAAAMHWNATSDHLHTALGDEDEEVRKAAVLNINATSDHLNTALKDDNSIIRAMAVSHPNTTLDHINVALKDEDSFVRDTAENPPRQSGVGKSGNSRDPFVVGQDVMNKLRNNQESKDHQKEEILNKFIAEVFVGIDLTEHTQDSMMGILAEAIESVFMLREALEDLPAVGSKYPKGQ